VSETKSRWLALRRWRDWGIPVKLAAVTLVPVVFAITLGALQIGSQIDRAESYRKIDRLVTVNDTLGTTVTWLQRERAKAAVLLTTGSPDIAAALFVERQSADAARTTLIDITDGLAFANETTATRRGDAVASFGQLDVLRGQVAAQQIDGPAALAGYTAVIRTLLAFDRAAAEEVADPTLSGTAGALRDLEAAKEEVYYQQGLVGVGVERRAMTTAELDALAASQARLDDHTADFRAIATPAQQAEYDRALPEPDVAARASLVQTVLGGAPGRAPQVAAADWNGASESISGKLSEVSAVLGAQIKNGSAALQDSASDAAGLASVILILALVAAAAIMFVIGRHILRSLSMLRHGALDVAERRLPAAVARLRDGDLSVPTVEPVAVVSADEVGEVARAFDAVHQQALRLATEQAGLRANYAGVFVNLSRRSQGLVQRQLQLLERLERDEEDADQLATLFQLDHLATRMRRNNENLMVLSGAPTNDHLQGRRSQQPVSLADLLRAAVSEVEHYQRIVIAPPPAVLIVGYAVGDLVRLTAELLDNAAAFSAPATQVTISSHHTPGGPVRIEVGDRGIGMKPDEFDEANTRLAEGGAVDESTSRRMGLFVVGRLAARHGVKVRLKSGTPLGVRAAITVPAELATSNIIGLAKAPTTKFEPVAYPKQVNGSTATDGAANPSVAKSSAAKGNAAKGNAANGHAVNGHSVNGAEIDRTENSGSNGAKVNGATANGLPRRAVKGAEALSALTKGDGAAMPESLPVPREAADAADPADAPDPLDYLPVANPLPDPEPAAAEEVAWPSLPVPTELDTDTDPAAVPALFGPVEPEPAQDSGWWDTTLIYQPGPQVDRGIHETTPIFDAMVSAWFREVTDDPNSTAADIARGPAWDFAADQGFQAAQAVSVSEPDTFTDSGLPRRTPRRNLVPGSAEPRVRPPIPARDAEDLRARLSNYQAGVHRARGAHHTGPAHGPADSLDLRGARWKFAADAGWNAADAVTKSTQDSHGTPTEGGLPRRTPRERLLPGSLDPVPGTESVRIERDAEALRTRLGSLQRGIGRGRDSLARQAVEQDHGNGAR
jgi:signal transduction histidine kinase